MPQVKKKKPDCFGPINVVNKLDVFTIILEALLLSKVYFKVIYSQFSILFHDLTFK